MLADLVGKSQSAVQMQAQASQNLKDDEAVLADLVGKSQSAVARCKRCRP